ncbi:multicopper oxidase family protein [Virgisporangium aurantiacum]|uniref:Copper oxidase n=1 Tax=Virgisporangium aurantiacum TaxID=175570 RepID=A0A8J3Z7X5_9ACTN|nr:multicopper oxidase family protein [Virgisporangium aurantiacum]GIJ56970.1 copper oxidase [Virgisporangium aurantiacum]
MLAVPGWLWFDSLLPGSYSVMDMGHVDLGGGPGPRDHANHHGTVSVADLSGDRTAAPDVTVTLTARQERFTLATGERIDGYTLDHQSPGPTIRAVQGDLVEVTLVNESIRAGTSLHWHGVDVPNAEDGVAGVTQDAVRPGKRHVYRFRVEDAGTYWYHSHQHSSVQVPGGLFGALVVAPRPVADVAAIDDVVAVVHSYRGLGTVSGRTGMQRAPAAAGTSVRVRVVNTEFASIIVSVAGAAYRVLALDGRDVVEPPEVRDKTVVLAGGGRVDLALTLPADGPAVRVDFGVGAALAIGPPTADVSPVRALEGNVDFLSYGRPAPIGFDPTRPDRRFRYVVDRRLGFVDGRLASWWTVNGRLYPDVPMFMVAEGDVVVMTIRNNFGSLHPMHLHGHHAVVLERNGVRATGSPWWTDSLDVQKGSTYVIAFVADNPGIWMDHCHNLTHSSTGLIAHLSYIGVSAPYRIGGPGDNHPD